MGSIVGETYLKRLMVFYIPLFLFVFVTLFPFVWMFITSIKPDQELYNPRLSPFLVREPTLSHWKSLLNDTLFVQWAINTLWVACASTLISLFAGVLAGYALARLIFPGSTVFGIAIFVTYLVPPTLLFIPLTGVISWMGLQDTTWSLIFAYPTFLGAVLHLAADGLFPDHPQGARGVRPDRRRDAHPGDGLHHPAARDPGHPVGRDLRLHAVLERVPVRAGRSSPRRPTRRSRSG